MSQRLFSSIKGIRSKDGRSRWGRHSSWVKSSGRERALLNVLEEIETRVRVRYTCAVDQHTHRMNHGPQGTEPKGPA